MTKVLLCCALALWGCSKETTSGDSCARACSKVLDCIGITSGDEHADCVARCEQGDRARVAQVARLGCDEILAELGQQLGGPPGGAAEQPVQGCTADCTGCVGDGTSCYAAAGGTHGIPCDECCCSSGRAPVWK